MYGDTDSLFVAMQPGVTKQQAFDVAMEMIKEITDLNPHPVKLKFEKVSRFCLTFTMLLYFSKLFCLFL